MGESVDVDTVTRAVRDMFKDKADFLPSPEIIIDEVGKFYGIDPDASGGRAAPRTPPWPGRSPCTRSGA